MTLGVHLADKRLAKDAAVKIRAALIQSVDTKKVITGYLATKPEASDSIAKDRARARAWVMLNVKLDNEALKLALKRHYGNMYVTGVLSVYESFNKARKAAKNKILKYNEIHDELGRFSSDPADAYSEVSSRSKDLGSKVSQTNRQALEDYQGDGYRSINMEASMHKDSAARLGITFEERARSIEAKGTDTAKMMAVFDKTAVPLSNEVVLYRGMSSDSILPTYNVGEVITPQGWLSTTADSERTLQTFLDGSAHGFGMFTPADYLPEYRTRMNITVPAGVKVMPGKSNERELILSPSTQMQVTGNTMVEGVMTVDLRVLK
jgi:hypothetical protein